MLYEKVVPDLEIPTLSIHVHMNMFEGKRLVRRQVEGYLHRSFAWFHYSCKTENE